MASKVRVAIRLDLDHELGHDHYQTWRSQLELAFMLHKVEDKKEQYLASAANLGESASYYLWQKFPGIPEGEGLYAELVALFDEYFGSQRSTDARLAELFSIEQRSGESIQAYRVRIEKEMRICNLTLSASVKDVLGIVSVHFFARGLAASAARKSVLEEGGRISPQQPAEHKQWCWHSKPPRTRYHKRYKSAMLRKPVRKEHRPCPTQIGATAEHATGLEYGIAQQLV